MTPPPASPLEPLLTSEEFGATEADRLALFHVPQDRDSLRFVIQQQLGELLPEGARYAVMTYEDQGGATPIVVHGDDLPLVCDQGCGLGDWPACAMRLPLTYQGATLGELQCDRTLEPETVDAVRRSLIHLAVALVNQTLHEQGQQATESYCASLMALEEGVILFQEPNPAAVTARFLSLATTMMNAPAGALFVLDEVGQLESNLELSQTLGFPEDLLESLRADDGGPWPHCFLGEAGQIFVAEASGALARIHPDLVPPGLSQLAVLPLTYHGVTAGLVILCNPEVGSNTAAALQVALDRMKSLGELGAALMHRLSLERINLRTRSIDTQLAIAANIHSRLQPREVPSHGLFDCSWSTVAAQSIGGDYIDLIEQPTQGLFAVIADASGHGINSALLMSSFRAGWRAEAPKTEPGALLSALNRDMCYEVGSTGMFITAATLHIDDDGRSFRMSSAGHNDVYVYRKASGCIETVDADGPPLGFVDLVDYEGRNHDLEPGDIIVLYTDGIVEATRKTGSEMFGDDRLKAVIVDHAERSADEIRDAILTEFATFTDSAIQEDDCSLSVIVRR